MRRVRARLALPLGAALLVCAVGIGAGWAAPDFAALAIQPYEPPKPAPALALPDLEGRTVRLEDFRGQVVLAFFWTTW